MNTEKKDPRFEADPKDFEVDLSQFEPLGAQDAGTTENRMKNSDAKADAGASASPRGISRTDGAPTVSYTHLDVYKRQLLGSSLAARTETGNGKAVVQFLGGIGKRMALAHVADAVRRRHVSPASGAYDGQR